MYQKLYENRTIFRSIGVVGFNDVPNRFHRDTFLRSLENSRSVVAQCSTETYRYSYCRRIFEKFFIPTVKFRSHQVNSITVWWARSGSFFCEDDDLSHCFRTSNKIRQLPRRATTTPSNCPRATRRVSRDLGFFLKKIVFLFINYTRAAAGYSRDIIASYNENYNVFVMICRPPKVKNITRRETGRRRRNNIMIIYETRGALPNDRRNARGPPSIKHESITCKTINAFFFVFF